MNYCKKNETDDPNGVVSVLILMGIGHWFWFMYEVACLLANKVKEVVKIKGADLPEGSLAQLVLSTVLLTFFIICIGNKEKFEEGFLHGLVVLFNDIANKWGNQIVEFFFFSMLIGMFLWPIVEFFMYDTGCQNGDLFRTALSIAILLFFIVIIISIGSIGIYLQEKEEKPQS